MSESIKNLKPKKFYARALDPIHIGTGGYRIGRVDNTILREPATNIPKIPGTSIAGTVRAFAENDKKHTDINIEEDFGTESKKGVLRFYDGQIILFPVSSIQGTVWITTKELIEYWFEEPTNIPEDGNDEAYNLKEINTSKPLNLGWILLNVKNGGKITLNNMINSWVKRVAVVSDKLFSHIVNDNLEVRTSVRIDSETGTAAEGALFTYEAIPRGTVLGFEVGVDNYRGKSTNVDETINAVLRYFKLLKLLGIGGLGTRGFGRLEVALSDNNAKQETKEAEDAQS